MDIVWRWVLIVKQNSDIIEIRLYDHTYQLFFKDKARIQNNKELKNLLLNLSYKGVKLNNLILENEWF